MSSSGSIPPTQWAITRNLDGTGNFAINDPALFNEILQAITSGRGRTDLVSIPPNLPSPFFRKLIDEINNVYSSNLFTSTYVCLRKLFENLVIELLRAKYGTSRIDLYYWAAKGRFHDFGVLIENLEQNVGDFASYTSAFDNNFFQLIKNFKEQANRSAHSIDIIENPDDLVKIKPQINQHCNLLCDVIRRVATTPQT